MEEYNIVKEWVAFAEMDYQTALHLNKTMVPKPREIICYHCEQAVEKILKAALIFYGWEIRKTHDLGMLAETLMSYMEVPESYLSMCEALTPFGIKARYPQELSIEEKHCEQALLYAKTLLSWVENALDSMADGGGS